MPLYPKHVEALSRALFEIKVVQLHAIDVLRKAPEHLLALRGAGARVDEEKKRRSTFCGRDKR